MKIKFFKNCPQEVKVQLQKWMESGWLTVESVENEVEDVSDITPPPSKSRNIEESQDSIEVQWVKRLKDIASKITKELDNQLITTNNRGYSGSYTFHFDSKGFCAMMDELLSNHSQYINNYIRCTRKPTGVNHIFPFLGKIINARLFNDDKLRKCDLKEIFKKFKYNGSTAVRKMSIHSKFDRNQDAKLLVEIAKSIAKKLVKSE